MNERKSLVAAEIILKTCISEHLPHTGWVSASVFLPCLSAEVAPGDFITPDPGPQPRDADCVGLGKAWARAPSPELPKRLQGENG